MEVSFLSYFKDLILTSLLYKVPRERRTKSRLRVKGSPATILGETELTESRILQEEQKTNMAPFWAIFYLFST